MSKLVFIIILIANTAQAEELHKHPTLQVMLQENNRLRVQQQLKPHTILESLTKAAQSQAQYMAQTHDFEHKTVKNGSPGTRAAKFKYVGIVRENIGRGLPNVEKVFEQWKKSPPHWQSITGNFKDVGFGYSIADDGTQYWVALYSISKRLELDH